MVIRNRIFHRGALVSLEDRILYRLNDWGFKIKYRITELSENLCMPGEGLNLSRVVKFNDYTLCTEIWGKNHKVLLSTRMSWKGF